MFKSKKQKLNTFKKIIGFLLIYGAGKEYVDASRQLGSPFSPGIIIGMFLILILCTWLLGSAFSKSNFKIKSLQFLKYFGISFLLFIIVAYFKLMTYVIPDDFVSINNIKIPLNKCIDGNINIIPNKNDRKDYCKCLAEKFTNDSIIKQKYKFELENGNLDNIIKKVQKEENFIDLKIENCINSIQLKWSDNIANSLKRNWKKELIGTEFENTYDIDKYCDCLINEYRKFPLDKIMEDGFTESKEALVIDEKCTQKSEK